MSVKKGIENNIVIFILTVAVGAFSAGWFAYSTVQSTSGIVPVSISELRELERKASLGKEDLFRENLDHKENEAKYEKMIADLHETIRRNRQIAKVTITNVILHPPSPATMRVGDDITVEFDYDIAKADSIEVVVGMWPMHGPRLTLTGKGRTKQRVNLHKSLVSDLEKSLDNNRTLKDIYVAYSGPVSTTLVNGREVQERSVEIAFTIPVAYKIITKY